MPPLSAPTVIMLALVAFIAVVIHRYSTRYLDGQPARAHYNRWFLATVSASALLVVAPDLRLLALAWTASSLSLHQLLNFFADRPQAQVSAHKKFMLSRLADVAIYSAVFLLGRSLGTYDIVSLGARAAELTIVPREVTVAGFLLVAGVVMRSAQLPFHGWLIQVMEAPTPVSALLHAGVVNVGGYVLIRLAALIGVLPGAQTMLVLFGATTATVAGFVMLTRVSIKVSLAWSTCAQMGFMLLECGLGAWELALLHLVAHSLYKAWAFLGSGSVVQNTVARRLAPPAPAASWGRWLGAALTGGAIALLVGRYGWSAGTTSADTLVPIVLLAMALSPMFTGLTTAHGWRPAVQRIVAALFVSLSYVLWHAAFRTVAPMAQANEVHTGLVVFTLASFALLAVLQALVTVRPYGALASRLYPLAYAGFHLDDLFTRATFLLWPPRHERRAPSPAPEPAPTSLVLDRAA